jgi:hypothetical protein
MQANHLHLDQTANIASAPADPIGRHELEKLVSLTGLGRIRVMWYRLRRTVDEMNYATRRLYELQCGIDSQPRRDSVRS